MNFVKPTVGDMLIQPPRHKNKPEQSETWLLVGPTHILYFCSEGFVLVPGLIDEWCVTGRYLFTPEEVDGR